MGNLTSIIASLRLKIGTIDSDNPLGTGFSPPSKAYVPESLTKPSIIHILVLFLSNLIGFLTILGGVFFIVYFFLGALQWILSGGDSGKAEKARNRMLQSVLGLVVMVASYSLIGLVGTLLGLDLIDLEAAINSIVPEQIE